VHAACQYHLQSGVLGGIGKNVLDGQDILEREAVRYQLAELELARLDPLRSSGMVATGVSRGQVSI